MTQTKTRVLVRFDYNHHDLPLMALLVGQAARPNSRFETGDSSMKEPSADWKAKARERTRRSGEVALICGEHTANPIGVSEEVRIAQDEAKPYFLLWGRSSRPYSLPGAALHSDKIYRWTWENLKSLTAGGR